MSVPFKDSTAQSRAPELLSRVELGGAFGPIGPNSTILWVDSNHATATTQDDTDGFYGRTRAFPTVQEAIDRINASAHHKTTFQHNLPMATDAVIVVAEGHSESITSATTFDLTKAGTKIIGLGHGTRRPKLLIDAISAVIEVSAANCWIEGIDIVASITGITSNVLNLDATATNFSLVDCRFYADAAHAAMPTGGPLTVNASATFANLRGNYFEWTSTPESLPFFPDGFRPKDTAYNYTPVSITFASGTTGAVGEHETLTVTNDVMLSTVIENVSGPTTGTGTVQFGVGGTTNAFLAATTGTDMNTGEYTYDATPVELYHAPVAARPRILFEAFLTNGTDVGYEIASSTVDDGTIRFHHWWAPLNGTSYANPGTGATATI